HRTGPGHLDGVIAEIGQAQIAQPEAAVGMRIGAHAALAWRSEFGKFRAELAGLVEQFLRAIALHPLFQNLHMPRLAHVTHRHLMRAEGAFRRFAVDHLWTTPAFW